MKNIVYKCLFMFLLMTIGCSENHDKQLPNIVIFLADDLGYNDVSCYRKLIPGQPDQPPTSITPNIDLLSGEGMKFTDFYAGAAVCSPSRAALLTGRNATRVGIYNWIPANSPMHLRKEEMTIAELIKDKGYNTAHFGKWHLTSPGTEQPLPSDQGFDYSFYTYNNAEPSHLDPVNFYLNGEEKGPLKGYACQLVVNEAIGWLDSISRERPFYINVWFNEPHVKLAAPEELTSRHPYNGDYYGAIENMDMAIGRLVSFLKDKGLDKNTIVIFTSDNGSEMRNSNDPFRGKKVFNYEGGVRVPFIIRWPGKILANSVNNTTGSFTDVLPTIAGITGSPLPSGRNYDGIDLGPAFENKSTGIQRNKPIFFYRYFHDPICMIREDDWVMLGYDEKMPYTENPDTRNLAKIKPGPGEPEWSEWGFKENHMAMILEQKIQDVELYRISLDPEQKVDLASEYPERVRQMKNEMTALKEEMVREGGNWYQLD